MSRRIFALGKTFLRSKEPTAIGYPSNLRHAYSPSLCKITSWQYRAEYATNAKQVEPSVGHKDGSHKKSWWDISTEWKIVTSFVVAVTSFFLNARMERAHLQKEMKLNRVQSQIKDLYGPLYGNRLVSDTSYRAVMKSHRGLRKYLHEARTKRDADMIHRWRSYVWNVLYPLDKAAVDMILNNAHLIAHGDFPKEFEELLMHAAKMEFVMEHWKSENGDLEPTESFTEDDYLEINNASGIGRRSRILEHVKQKYDELREQQQQISLEISNEKQADSALGALFKRAIK